MAQRLIYSLLNFTMSHQSTFVRLSTFDMFQYRRSTIFELHSVEHFNFAGIQALVIQLLSISTFQYQFSKTLLYVMHVYVSYKRADYVFLQHNYILTSEIADLTVHYFQNKKCRHFFENLPQKLFMKLFLALFFLQIPSLMYLFQYYLVHFNRFSTVLYVLR